MLKISSGTGLPALFLYDFWRKKILALYLLTDQIPLPDGH